MKRTVGLIFLVTSLAATPSAWSQSEERMRFQAGNDNAYAENELRGDQYRDYILGARRGQQMNVSLSTPGTAYFNILAPGSGSEAVYNSSMAGNDGSVTLPSSGDYRIRVYLMGADASENRRVSYTLSVGIN